MTIDEVLAVLERDRGRHMLAEPCVEADLKRLEGAIGCALPSGFRRLLLDLGCGIFYEKHEVFGAHRLMVHDIELVPDLLSMRRREGRQHGSAEQLPFHRAAGVIHYLDLNDAQGRVLPGDHSPEALDLATFLERVVLPSGDRPAAAR